MFSATLLKCQCAWIHCSSCKLLKPLKCKLLRWMCKHSVSIESKIAHAHVHAHWQLSLFIQPKPSEPPPWFSSWQRTAYPNYPTYHLFVAPHSMTATQTFPQFRLLFGWFNKVVYTDFRILCFITFKKLMGTFSDDSIGYGMCQLIEKKTWTLTYKIYTCIQM